MGIKRNPRQGDSRLIRILLGAMWLVADWVGDTKFFSVEILDGFLGCGSVTEYFSHDYHVTSKNSHLGFHFSLRIFY